MNILITSAGGTLIPLLTKFIKEDEQLKISNIIGIDQKKKIKKNKYLHKFYQIKINNNYSFLEKIKIICIKEKIKLIIPYSDNEAKILAKNKKIFLNKGIKILVNNLNILNKINNKYLTYSTLQKKKIRVPKFKLIKNFSDLKKNLTFFNYPSNGVVIKPTEGIGGRGVIILPNKNKKYDSALLGKRGKIIKNLTTNKTNKSIFKYGDVLMMDLLKSPAYDVDCYKIKKKVHVVIRKRINPSGIPYKGNFIVKNSSIENYCKSIIKKLKINSLVDIDLLTDSNNRPVLLEINPRPSGSLVTTYMAGIPVLSVEIAKALNLKYKFSFNNNLPKKIKF